MDAKLKLYDKIVEKVEPDDLVEHWDFLPLDMEPSEDHDLAAEGGFDLRDFLSLGEMADTSLYMLWLGEGLPLDESPVILLTADGEYGVVAEHFEAFLSLMNHVGGQIVDLLGIDSPHELQAQLELLHSEVPPESLAFGEALLTRFNVERFDPAVVIGQGNSRSGDLRIPLADSDYEPFDDM